MNLPMIKKKTYFMVLPSTGKKVKYHAMDAGTEKKIGQIKEGYRAVFENLGKSDLSEDELKLEFSKQMKDLTTDVFREFAHCFPSLNMHEVTEGDFEAMQIELKRRCVDNKLSLQVSCPKCGTDNTVNLDLDTVKLKNVPTSKDITLDDGSILTLRHIPMHEGTMNMDLTDEVSAEYDYIVNAFATLRYKVDNNFDDIDMTKYKFEDKVAWADQSINIEHKKEILDFLSEAPGIEPIELSVKACKHKTLDGKSVPDDPTFISNMIKKQMAEDPDGVPIMQRIESCNNSYTAKVYSLSQFFF